MTTSINASAAADSPITEDEAELLVRLHLDQYRDSLAEALATATVPDPVIFIEYRPPAINRYQVRSRAVAPTTPGVPDYARAALRAPQNNALAAAVALLPSQMLIFFQFQIPRLVWVLLFGIDSKGVARERSLMMDCPRDLEV